MATGPTGSSAEPPLANMLRSQTLREVLAYAAYRLALAAVVQRLLLAGAVAVMFPLLVVMADHVLPGGLPRPVIVGMGAFWLLAALSLLVGVPLRTLRRRLSRLYVAQQIERWRQIPHNSMINAVLLQGDQQTGYSRDGAEQQAERVLSASDSHASFRTEPLRGAALLLAAAVGFWFAYAAVTPKPILPSLQRLFGVNRDAPTATTLSLVKPSSEQPAYAGYPLEFRVALRGQPAEAVRLELMPQGDDDAAAPLAVDLTRCESSAGAPEFETTLAPHEVVHDLHYRVSAGDATLTGVIPVYPRADVREVWVELQSPEYVDLPDGRSDSLDIQAWTGTRAAFTIVANTDLRNPVFALRGAGEVRTRMVIDAEDPRRARVTLPLRQQWRILVRVFRCVEHAVCRSADPPDQRSTRCAAARRDHLAHTIGIAFRVGGHRTRRGAAHCGLRRLGAERSASGSDRPRKGIKQELDRAAGLAPWE